MIAKMPAESDFVRFKKMKQSYLVLGEQSNIAVAASAQVEEACRNDAIDPESSIDRRSTYSSPGLMNQCRVSFWCRNPMLRFGVLPSIDVACEE